MSRLGQLGGRLYRGEVSYDFVGRKRRWYAISGAILLISIVALFVHGLDFSVDFKGGAVFQFSAPGPRRPRSRTRSATLVSTARSCSSSPASWATSPGRCRPRR